MNFKKILVIFFLAFLILYFIYKTTFKEKLTYLAIGDDLAKGHTPFDTYEKSYTDYLYEYLKTNKNYKNINKTYIKEDLRIKDLISALKENKQENKTTLTSLIKTSSLITISIGSEELFSKIRSNKNLLATNQIYKTIDEMIKDLTELTKLMRKLTKQPIYIIGYYNIIEKTEENSTKINSIFNYLDIKFKTLEKETKITYINIYNGFNENPKYLPNKTNSFPSLEGYNYIADQIIEKIKES